MRKLLHNVPKHRRRLRSEVFALGAQKKHYRRAIRRRPPRVGVKRMVVVGQRDPRVPRFDDDAAPPRPLAERPDPERRAGR